MPTATSLHTLLCYFFCFAFTITYAQEEPSKKPNILFIFADDHCYDLIAAAGHPQIETPNIDKLYENGTHFIHAYNSGAWNGAVCMASRAMMMTGKQLWAAYTADKQQLIDSKAYFPQRMQGAGYTTYYSGKWHVGSTEQAKATWINTANIRPGMPNQTDTRYQRTFTGEDTWSPSDPAHEGFWKGGKHWSEIVAEDAEDFLASAAQDPKPFLCMLAFNAPHDPRQAPQSYQHKYPYENMEVPVNFLPDYPHDNGAITIRDEQLAPFPRTPHSIRVNRSEYFALITHMDTQIGRILEALKDTGKADNTYIFFTADHGLSVGQHGLLGKQSQYDHSVRVPWIITGPNIPKGKTNSSPIYLQDAMATCLDIADANTTGIEFDSVLPLINTPKKQPIYGAYIHFQRMIRTATHKYIIYPNIGIEKLFDMETDPHETTNLIDTPELQETLTALRQELAKQMKERNDPLDLSDPQPLPQQPKKAKTTKTKKG